MRATTRRTYAIATLLAAGGLAALLLAPARGEPPASREDVAPVAAKEAAPKHPLVRKLAEPVTAEFIETPLSDVLDFLSDLTSVQFYVARPALEEVGLATDAPITLHLRQASLKTVLELALAQVGDLQFEERDGLLYVSTPADLQRRREVRVYGCRDLLALVPAAKEGVAPARDDLGPLPPSPPTPGERLVDLVSRAVDPDSWESAGGSASIHEFGGLLVVSHSRRAQEQVATLLAKMREAAGLPAAEPPK